MDDDKMNAAIEVFAEELLTTVDTMVRELPPNIAVVLSLGALARAFTRQVLATKEAINLNPQQSLRDTCMQIIDDEVKHAIN
jgi:hypothetical protein